MPDRPLRAIKRHSRDRNCPSSDDAYSQDLEGAGCHHDACDAAVPTAKTARRPGRSTSAIPSGRSRAASGLRPVISLGDRDVRHGVALPQAQRVLIFDGAITSKRGVVVGKLDHHEP